MTELRCNLQTHAANPRTVVSPHSQSPEDRPCRRDKTGRAGRHHPMTI